MVSFCLKIMLCWLRVVVESIIPFIPGVVGVVADCYVY